MLVEVENLTRSFGDVKAVQDVSLAFDRGTVFGFIGPNGAGKTTTMRILATLDTPDEGDARIAGDSVVDYPDRVRRRIGFLPDAYGTYANTPVLDYLDFFGRSYGLRGRELARKTAGVIEFTGLGTIRDKATSTLSKGMKQRLALARTLLHDPDVLILDEPAAGLDPRARIEFRELVKLIAREGRAVLISSHILTELSELVDACAIIERGRIVCQGTVAEVRELARAQKGAATSLSIELLEERPECESFLLEQPFVIGVFGGGAIYTAEFAGDRGAASGLLRDLIAAGFPVVGFRARETDLEDVFMTVTKGEVQ